MKYNKSKTKNKPKNKHIKEVEYDETDELESHFDPISAWQCNECGEIIAPEYEQMEDHLSGHDITIGENDDWDDDDE